MPDSPAELPATVRHYALYLRAKTKITPETIVNGARAAVRLSAGDKALMLVFGCRNTQWSLYTIEVHQGEQTTAFPRSELAEAIAALARDEPLGPPNRSATAHAGRQPRSPARTPR
jgi:hypothetical protein